MNKSFWQGKRVFLTGHTGFKGGWLALWLHDLGAEVHGYALAPATDPSLFNVAKVDQVIASHTLSDIRNLDDLQNALVQSRPDIVFHLAAQPLVRYSYHAPIETYSTNVMGTVNLLEAVRHVDSIKAVINVTTDKCYENREWHWPYREDEALGGYDPYSSSKACSEIVTAAYRRSFLANQNVAIASARAGNVIGGGDWSCDRLIPDFLRATDAGETLSIRSPRAIRPWQHVLEPLSGYLLLAEKLFQQPDNFAEAWNFGPSEDDAKSVEWIVNYLASIVPTMRWQTPDKPPSLHEAGHLKLDSSKARSLLGWKPCWNIGIALDKTVEWHRAWRNKEEVRQVTLEQIRQYQSAI